jgi:hypothetical protein
MKRGVGNGALVLGQDFMKMPRDFLVFTCLNWNN